ncbi:hypothetical protein DFH08DRAFT_812201 [Mycena albidolilacea]|uniref:Uncharacterized protein n=1 Tax=Mycena albidolilacea TaxID=1033008 RepID=A0AAD7EP46_9AGAR|nr:hypothetical protein DFH08DRAFT_812201 [Mycena albidolilacea]
MCSPPSSFAFASPHTIPAFLARDGLCPLLQILLRKFVPIQISPTYFPVAPAPLIALSLVGNLRPTLGVPVVDGNFKCRVDLFLLRALIFLPLPRSAQPMQLSTRFHPLVRLSCFNQRQPPRITAPFLASSLLLSFLSSCILYARRVFAEKINDLTITAGFSSPSFKNAAIILFAVAVLKTGGSSLAALLVFSESFFAFYASHWRTCLLCWRSTCANNLPEVVFQPAPD